MVMTSNISTDTETSIYISLLRTMLLIRVFEEKVAELASKKEFGCPVHLYIGQEAIAAGICACLEKTDYCFSTHRSHGHFIGKGGSINMLMAEIYGKLTGSSLGHGGSMHVAEPAVGFMGSSAIVAGTIPLAVGAAFSAQYRKDRRISVAFFGDGATDEGVFYESINLAALYKLPLLFVCENNSFSTHMPDFLRQSNTRIFDRIKGFNIESKRIDGNNAVEIYSNTLDIVKTLRDGKGPFLLELMTYRWLAHVGPEEDVDVGFRTKDEIDRWKKRCPIKILKNYLIKNIDFDESDYNKIEKQVISDIESAVNYAKNSPYPDMKTFTTGLF